MTEKETRKRLIGTKQDMRKAAKAHKLAKSKKKNGNSSSNKEADEDFAADGVTVAFASVAADSAGGVVVDDSSSASGGGGNGGGGGEGEGLSSDGAGGGGGPKGDIGGEARGVSDEDEDDKKEAKKNEDEKEAEAAEKKLKKKNKKKAAKNRPAVDRDSDDDSDGSDSDSNELGFHDSEAAKDGDDDGDDGGGGADAEKTTTALALVGMVEVLWNGRTQRVCFPMPVQARMLTDKTKHLFMDKARLFTTDKRLELMFGSTDLFVAEMDWVHTLAHKSRVYRLIGRHLDNLKLGMYSLAVLLNINVLMSPPSLAKPLDALINNLSTLKDSERASLFLTFALGALNFAGYLSTFDRKTCRRCQPVMLPICIVFKFSYVHFHCFIWPIDDDKNSTIAEISALTPPVLPHVS